MPSPLNFIPFYKFRINLKLFIKFKFNFSSQPGFLNGIISQMSILASAMTPVERMCAIVLDEMAIKRQFDSDSCNDAIYGASPSGDAAKQAICHG